VAGDADLQSHGALCASGGCSGDGVFNGGNFARENDLTWRVAIRKDEDAARRPFGDDA
jgi:hypothetical protein